MLPISREALLAHFMLSPTVDYHPQTQARVAHLTGKPLQQASVLIGFVKRTTGLHVIFTRRAEHLKHHPGQISFPGGKFEEEDGCLQNTALREAHEEVGIRTHDVEIIGQLPPLMTVSQFTVTPIVAFVDPHYPIQTDPNEVAEVFEVPAHILLDPKQLHSCQFEFRASQHCIFALTYQKHFIWGMTAQIIQAMQQQLILLNQ